MFEQLSNLSPTVLALIAVWSLVWKGLALWKSSKQNNKIWFIVILIVNTVGILEILYLYVFSKMQSSPKASKKKSKSLSSRKSSKRKNR